MRRTISVAIICLTALAACDDEKKQEQEAPSLEGASEKTKSALKAAEQTSEMAREATKAMGEGAAPGSASWEMEISGTELSEISGSSVMVSPIGPGVMYKLIGAQGTASIMLKGVKKFEPGTFKPYSFTVTYPTEKIQCGYSKLNEEKMGDVLEVKIEKDGDGIKATVEGDVACRKVGESDGPDESQKASVKGWFKDS